MGDAFKHFGKTLQSPPSSAAAIVPDDGADLPSVTRAINVAGTGDVRVTTLDGDVVTLHVAGGSAFPIRVRRVHATGTTATGLVALW